MLRSLLFWKLFLWAFGLVALAAIAMSPGARARWGLPADPDGYASSALLVGGGALGLAALAISHVVRPVLALGRAARSIGQGDYQQRAYVSNNDELGQMAESLNQLSHELGAQLSELREGNQQQATVLGGMIEGVIAIDNRERILFANAAAGRLFGFLPPRVEGRPLLEVVRHHALHEAVAATLTSQLPQRVEIDWEGDEAFALSVQVTPLPGEPCPGVVTVLHDVTELRRLETIRQDFLANVSHELKTPLSSIKAYTETLLNGAIDDTENRGRFLQRIEEQADRLNNLIQDMLSLARIESAQQALHFTAVGVAQIVAACLEDYTPQAQSKQIDLAIVPGDASLAVKADPEGLRVILNNLIDNAIKYTPEGGRVRVSWRGEGEAGEMVAIEVEDTGIGIPKSKLPRVFERFYRVDRARSREMGGTGLGLSIVKHLTQSFGGRVSVRSESQTGSTFSVHLQRA
ncbi:Alkaline phosphatase synthesis sensor protein PhoR [Pirellulimonas nuda]|uniref:histidine kinase n=1 Tax=Pirellulimonas nuda TaxID=2528009 RepID=A0A518D7L7_9BACT|nr:HAMP domain-containing sensor histidine kinase [Pirellulimonas nuda]QDU87461.1 Alkaline phosphatase synthesis sensor protein PhoR [Pirellulimonas nuda]